MILKRYIKNKRLINGYKLILNQMLDSMIYDEYHTNYGICHFIFRSYTLKIFSLKLRNLLLNDLNKRKEYWKQNKGEFNINVNDKIKSGYWWDQTPIDYNRRIKFVKSIIKELSNNPWK